MRIPGLEIQFHRLHGDVPATHARVLAEQWIPAARAVHASHGRVVALWGADNRDRSAGFSVLAAVMMWVLVRAAWPDNVERSVPESAEAQEASH